MARSEKLLAAFLLVAGIAHFANPEFFDAIVPPALPGSQRLATYLSGAGEVVVGLGILFGRTRRVALWAAAVVFIAVYPANLYMAWDWRDRELSERLVAFGRLPLQIPLIWWSIVLARRATSSPPRT